MALDFNAMSILLAAAHNVSMSKLTKFQARLKNLHRVGWPMEFQSVKGKPSVYSAGDIIDMAVALELMQLGMTPERLVQVLKANRWQTLMAYNMAARQLAETPMDFVPNFPPEMEVSEEDLRRIPSSMYLYFDPVALHGLSLSTFDGAYEGMEEDDEDRAEKSFFYAGTGIVMDLIGGWNSSATRLSLVNVSALLFSLSFNGHDKGGSRDIQFRQRFYQSVADWAAGALASLEDAEMIEEQYMMDFIARGKVEIVANDDKLAAVTGIERERAKKYITKFMKDAVAEAEVDAAARKGAK